MIKKMNKLMEGKTEVCLAGMFLSFCLVRGILALNYAYMHVFADEWLYWNLSKSFLETGLPEVRGFLTNFPGIIYPLLLSVCRMITSSAQGAYAVALCMNTLLICSACIPAYLLCQRMSIPKKKSLLVAGLVLLMPEMTYGLSIQQEALHFPFFVWFLYIFYVWAIEEKRPRCSRLILLGVMSYLLELTKQLSLACTLAVVLYFIVQMLLERKELKGKVRCIGAFLVGNIATRILWGTGLQLYYTLRGVETTSYTQYSTFVDHLFKIDTYTHAIYPTIVYLILFILMGGIVPGLIVFSQYGSLEKKNKKVVVLTACMWLGLVATTYLIILIREGYTSEDIRFHYRYLYFLMVPVYGAFYSIEDKLSVGARKRSFYVVNLLFSILVLCPSLVPALEGSTDCPSGVLLESVRNSYGYLVMIGIAAVSIFFLVCLRIQKIHLMYAVSTALLILGSLGSNVLIYMGAAQESGRTGASMIKEAQIMNDLLGASDEDILLVGESYMSGMALELWLDFDYYMCTEPEFAKWMAGEGKELTVQVIKNQTSVRGYMPHYIISEREYELLGYDQVDWTVPGWYLYERNTKKTGIRFLWYSEDVYADQWMEEKALIEAYSTLEENTTILNFKMDTFSPEPVTITVSDACGNEQQIVVNPGEEKEYQITVERENNDVPYMLQIQSSVIFSTPTDQRDMSVRVLGIEMERGNE